MLAELFFTPDALFHDNGRDGAEVVRELTNYLFPLLNTSTALICKLGENEWTQAVSKKIAGISNANHRQLAMALLTRLIEHLSVPRPPVKRNRDDESGWIEAATESSKKVPLERIIVSQKSLTPTPGEATIKDLISPTFWEKLKNPRLVKREKETQRDILRAICTHSDWLLIRLPQIRGSSDDEIVTVKQVLELSTRLPPDFRTSDIDLQVCLQEKIPEDRLVRSITDQLMDFLKRKVKIELTIWPKGYFINRELIGGEYARTSQGMLIPKPLWLITMSHVAVGKRPGASTGEAGNTWNLFSRQEAHERYQQIKSDLAGKLHSLSSTSLTI